MPSFKWYALDGAGTVIEGIDFARSAERLGVLLQARGYALVSYRAQSLALVKSCSQELAQFFAHVASLLAAHVRLVDALVIARSTIKSKYFQLVVDDCIDAVQEGIPWGTACAFHEHFFSPMICQLLYAGQESGTLQHVCKDIATYFSLTQQFRSHIRTLLMMPALTALCFLGILICMFVVVIPRFAILLRSLHKPLPGKTALLIRISDTLMKVHPFILCLVVVGVLGALWYGLRLLMRAEQVRMLALLLPGSKTVIYSLAAVAFFRTLGTLLSAGVDVVKALHIALESIELSIVRQRYAAAARDVESGIPLHQALSAHGLATEPLCQAYLMVGVSSGNLGLFVLKCADYYQDQLQSIFKYFALLLQPFLLLLLGLAVAFVVITLYEPIFTMGLLVS